MFEKYDGIRGFWNPHKRKFLSRRNNEFKIPQDIVDAMPKDTFLDGEIWYNDFLALMQNNNQKTYTIVLNKKVWTRKI
jgi:ATP-dependent DNA ligase